MSTVADTATGEDAVAYEPQEQDLVAITTDVWGCFLDEEVYPVPDEATTPDEESWLASVGITGPWGGRVLLELPTAGAELAARRMLGVDDVSALDVLDALGELSNMVGGNFKSMLPHDCQLGLPVVVPGPASTVTGPGTTEICRAQLGWADTTVRVSVWTTTTTTTIAATAPITTSDRNG